VEVSRRVIIMGAAGRDFHNFNTFFRKNSAYHVVAFTATQIPGISGRVYPPSLAGPLYPAGIPIFPESELATLIKDMNVDLVVFAYSDVSHEYVMHEASRVLAVGANFMLMGPKDTMLKAALPVVAVTAVRTGSGKSQTSGKVSTILCDLGYKVVVLRHPMPYGNLAQQACQRFATEADLERHEATIEEREEYEQHLLRNVVVYAGVDYDLILRSAQAEADIVIWDGGNNDMPFIKPDLYIVVADALRPGHETTYFPGEVNLRAADVVVINKVDSANRVDVDTVKRNAKTLNPKALIIEAASPITADKPSQIKGKRVLVVEDGPTLTHGEMTFGAGIVAARQYGAAEVIDPRPYAVGSIAEVYRRFPHIGPLLPAMGYGRQQLEELEQTIRAVPCDIVLSATPVDLARIVHVNKPVVRVYYDLEEVTKPDLTDVLRDKFGRRKASGLRVSGGRR
jgi:predicted GTPase